MTGLFPGARGKWLSTHHMCHLLLADKSLLGGSVDSASCGPGSWVFETPKLNRRG